MSTCIALTDVSKRYGSTMAVDRLSLEVQTGEVLGLLGPNGAGKSTTLSMLTGLVRPTSGDISLFGKDLRGEYIEIAKRVGVVVERPVFYEYLSTRRNMKVHARLAQHAGNVDRILDLVGLLHVANKKAGVLSHGLRQRLALAQALLTEPELLILDEPTAGMDVESTQDVLTLLRRLADEARVTIVFSSHLMQEVETLCDRVAILNEGRLLTCEQTDALLSFDPSRVEVLVDAAERAGKRLREQSWVAAVEIYPGRVAVRLGDATVHQLTCFLVNGGFQVFGVIPRRRTLKDFFLRVLNQ